MLLNFIWICGKIHDACCKTEFIMWFWLNNLIETAKHKKLTVNWASNRLIYGTSEAFDCLNGFESCDRCRRGQCWCHIPHLYLAVKDSLHGKLVNSSSLITT